jgi:RHS repeat-associated protein
VEDGAGEEHYRRDERGRLVELIRKVDGRSYHVQHAYDDLDRLTSRAFPDDRSLDYHYNPRSLLESVPGVISSIAYDPRGLVTRREHANGAVTTASYDDLSRLSTLGTESRGKTVQSLGYRYDQVGNLTAIDDALRKSGPLSAGRTCGYDDLYRLVSAVGGGHSWTYAFNAVGDFTKKSDVGEYSYAKAHLVASAGGKSYRHDEAGNTIERPGSKLAFDAKGRVKSVALEDGTAVTYRYDYTGRRVVKESRGPKGDHKTVYVDAASEERDGQAIDYVMVGRTRLARLGGKEPVQVAAGFLAPVPPALTALAATLLALALLFGLARAQVPARSAAALGSVCSLLALTTSGCNCGHSAGTVAPIPATHYHGDHLGGTMLLTTQDGSVAAEIAYDPWGAEIVGATEPYAFTGKEYEPDTGLYDFEARVYDPVLARFLSRDPASLANPAIGIGDPQILNPFAYVRNSPATYVDRDGREPNVAGDEAGVNEILRDRQFQATGAKETLEQAKPIAEGALQATPVGGAYVAATGQRLTGGEATRAERAFGAATAFGGVILKGLGKVGQSLSEWRAARAAGNAAGGGPTRFINGVRVVDRRTGTVLEGTVDLKPTLDRIASGGRLPHRNDGSIFQNRSLPGRTSPELPAQAPGYYHEYVHPTPGVSGPGPQRVVVGQGGERFYTPDHYQSFIPLQ